MATACKRCLLLLSIITISAVAGFDKEMVVLNDASGVMNSKLAISPDDILLEVIDPLTGNHVTEAPEGSSVQLRMRLINSQGGVPISGMTAYDCWAFSPDWEHFMQLINEQGCPGEGSPVGCLTGKNGTLTSPPFDLFSLSGYDQLEITCSGYLCFKPDDHHCSLVHCDHSVNVLDRQPRDTKQARRPSTSIRVLPSLDHTMHRHHHHDNLDPEERVKTIITSPSGPLLYLNPITCSLFLIILCLFMGFYVTFLRSLRRSIEDIKQEIQTQRSRDKFLVP